MPDLTVVVPAFRERDNIPPLVDALERALAGIDWEVIVVVDDGFDGTEEVVRERAQKDARVRCLHRIGRRGLSSACVEGILASSAPYVAVMDADMQHDETLLPAMLATVEHSAVDIVVGSRYMPEGSTGDLPADRVFISRLASVTTRMLTPTLTDPMSGFFLLRRAYFDQVARRLYGRGFKILLDLVAAAPGEVRIAEHPYRMRSRRHGESKLGTKVIAEFLLLLVYHTTGRRLPVRMIFFAAVGLTGVAVHLAVLGLLFRSGFASFLTSQIVATACAMTSNFMLNNSITYADLRLRGGRFGSGLLTFYIACGVGAFINLVVAEWLYTRGTSYWIAGMSGAALGAFWNFVTTAEFTWTGALKRSA